VNPVIKALHANGIEVIAVHSLMLDEQPRLFFLHFRANNDALKLARVLRAALDKGARSQNIENNPMQSSKRPAWMLRKQVDTSGKSGAFLHHPVIL
jgi:uncharacterized protein DUF1259